MRSELYVQGRGRPSSRSAARRKVSELNELSVPKSRLDQPVNPFGDGLKAAAGEQGLRRRRDGPSSQAGSRSRAFSTSRSPRFSTGSVARIMNIDPSMGSSLDLSLDAGFPLRQPGESQVAYAERKRAWVLRAQSGAMGLGLPPSGPKYLPAPDGRGLGDFELPGAGNLPPVRHDRPPEPPAGTPPASRSGEEVPAFRGGPSCPPRLRPGQIHTMVYYDPSLPYCEEPAAASFSDEASSSDMGLRTPPVSRDGTFGGPAGIIPVGLREPWDPVAPTADALEREAVLARTGFDLAWGAPPPRGGLAWDISRYVYAPVQDATGVGYRNLARDGLYLQAYQGASLGPDVWGVRWVSTASRPYRVLPSNEAYAAWLRVQQYEAIRRKGPEPELVSGAEEELKVAGPSGAHHADRRGVA